MLPVLALAPGSVPLPSPPKAHVDPVAETIHGVTITDNYRWLEEQNSPGTRAWIAAEQRYTAEFFGSLPQRANIRQSLAKFERLATRSVPVTASGKYFFTHRGSAEEQASLYMRHEAAGSDEKLVDPNALSPDHSVSVLVGSVTRDGSILAYEFRKGGQDETEVHFLDVNAKRDLPDLFPRARYGFAGDYAFTPDSRAIYYSKWLTEGSRVYRHQLGTPVSKDKEVFGAGYGPDYSTSCIITSTGRYLFCEAERGAATTEEDFYVQELGRDTAPRVIAKHVPAVLDVEAYRDSIYLLTSSGTPNGRVVEVDLDRPALSDWKEIVPQGRNPITKIAVAANRLFVTTLEDVSERLHAYTLNGKTLTGIRLPAAGTTGEVRGEEQGPEAFFSFSSFAYPNEIFKVAADGSTSSWWRSTVPLRADEIEVKQVWYASKDGTKIPMFIVARKGQEQRNRPALLTGYGGFNIALTPRWSAVTAWWLEQGGVFALPALRGGGEFGEAWHKAGMLDKKQNVFDDFIAAAEHLIHCGLTSREKLAIVGTSNGGLLVGAAMTQRPDLFRAVVCGAPLLDMIRYQNFKIAKLWVPEYGSSDDPQQFSYIVKYSPYQHIERGVKYPAVMFWTGDNDTRVDPLHARKMTALMQAEAGGERPILIRYDTLTGHSGGKSVDQQLDFDTDLLAFVKSQIG
jgi:prolyl oligopeptidase